MTTFLPRVYPSADDKPLPSTGTAEVFRVFARDLAAGRRSWDGETARFIADQFDQMAAEWDTTVATGRDEPLRDALLFPAEIVRVLAPNGVLLWINQLGEDGPLHLPAMDVAHALPGDWQAVEADAGWGSWAVLRRSC